MNIVIYFIINAVIWHVSHKLAMDIKSKSLSLSIFGIVQSIWAGVALHTLLK